MRCSAHVTLNTSLRGDWKGLGWQACIVRRSLYNACYTASLSCEKSRYAAKRMSDNIPRPLLPTRQVADRLTLAHHARNNMRALYCETLAV